MNTGQRRLAAIAVLMVCHVAAAVALAPFCDYRDNLLSVAFTALMLSQTSLLGAWTGFGRTHFLLRLAGTGLGVVLITFVMQWNTPPGATGMLLILTLVITSLVALVTWMVRLWKARLIRHDERDILRREELQFTIRHLLLLTLLIAFLLTVAKGLAPQFDDFEAVAQMCLLGIYIVMLALTSIWAILASETWAKRLPLVFLVAGAAGGAAGLLASGHYGIWVSIMMLDALFLTVSLAVIRWSGFRLVTKAR
jgi:hypothetical protein